MARALRRIPQSPKPPTPGVLWALKILSQGMKQMMNIEVDTQENGEYVVTRNGGLTFHATGRKDIAYAMMLAWVAFLLWLKAQEDDFQGGKSEESGSMNV